MIYLMIKKSQLSGELERELKKLEVDYRSLDITQITKLQDLYTNEDEVTAAIVDDEHPELQVNCWFDMLSSLCRRIPIIVVSKKEKQSILNRHGRLELLIWLTNPKVADIFSTLDISGGLGLRRTRNTPRTIPFYNPLIAIQMLQSVGSLSILAIHTGSFRKIGTEFGSEAYLNLRECFQKHLLELWGAKLSFRKSDTLCLNTIHGHVYYIFLDQSRTDKKIPAPGALERLSDRLVKQLQKRLWNEIFVKEENRQLPKDLTVLPKFSIGYSSGIHNPCFEIESMLERIIHESTESAKIQEVRTGNRQKEMMQALIKTSGALVPNYQAVFEISQMDREEIEQSTKSQSIKCLSQHIYGFESLVRLNHELVEWLLKTKTSMHIDAKHLVPNVLFGIAKNVKLALELDQACIQAATLQAQDLPGRLLVNILPRNFYYIEHIQQMITSDVRVTFEVSESEAINNFELLLKARKRLNEKNFGIAIDDFGKGYAGLDRLLKIKPDIIKLDRCLIQDIHEEPPKIAFVSGIVNAAKMTQSKVLAEGIERIEEFETLKKLGVDLAQGFLLHRPQPVERVQGDLEIKNDSIDQAS